MEPRLDPAGLHELVAQRQARLLGHPATTQRRAARPAGYGTNVRRRLAHGLRRLAERVDTLPDRPRPHPA